MTAAGSRPAARRRLGDALANLGQTVGACAHASRLSAGGQRLGVVGIGRQRSVEGLARLVALAQGGEADAVVGQQARIARQAAQRMFVQRPGLGGPAEIDQHTAEIGQHQRIVGRQPRGALQRPPRLVEALEAAQRQALVVERPHVVGRLLEIGLQGLERLGELAALDVEKRELQDGVAVERILAQRPLQQVDGLVALAGRRLGKRQRLAAPP